MKTKGSKNLETRFDKEDDSMDKMELSFKDLGAPIVQEGMKTEATGADVFSPSATQWNSLFHRVETLTITVSETA